MNALLQETLQAFGLTRAEFIQQHENAVYRADEKYLLRIHQAAEGVHVIHDPAAQSAELAFLRHLADKGLTVQRPVAETALSDGTEATLLTWLYGSSLHKEDMSPELLHQAGALASHHASPAGSRSSCDPWQKACRCLMRICTS